MNTRSRSLQLLDGYQDQMLPQILVLDIADLIQGFNAEWNNILQQHQHELGYSVKPNIDRMVRQVIEVIRQENDADLELASMAYNDIASLLHYQFVDGEVVEVVQYGPLHVELANVTFRFGQRVIQRFRNESLYHFGFFPYKFKCYVGTTVAVEFVEKWFNPTPEYTARKGDNYNVSVQSTPGHFPDFGLDQYI